MITRYEAIAAITQKGVQITQKNLPSVPRKNGMAEINNRLITENIATT